MGGGVEAIGKWSFAIAECEEGLTDAVFIASRRGSSSSIPSIDTAKNTLAIAHKINSELIEHPFAHEVPDTFGTAYNHTRFQRMRTSMTL